MLKIGLKQESKVKNKFKFWINLANKKSGSSVNLDSYNRNISLHSSIQNNHHESLDFINRPKIQLEMIDNILRNENSNLSILTIN